MAENRIHCVVVSGASWGIVSDLDLMASLRPGVTATAGELAASDVVAVDPADTLEHAAQLMAEHDTAHLVVVSPDTGRPVGARRRPLGSHSPRALTEVTCCAACRARCSRQAAQRTSSST